MLTFPVFNGFFEKTSFSWPASQSKLVHYFTPSYTLQIFVHHTSSAGVADILLTVDCMEEQKHKEKVKVQFVVPCPRAYLSGSCPLNIRTHQRKIAVLQWAKYVPSALSRGRSIAIEGMWLQPVA